MPRATKMTEEERAMYSDNWGGRRKNCGRKQLYKGGRKQLAISCGAEQKAAIQEAARQEGLTTAQYILKKCGLIL